MSWVVLIRRSFAISSYCEISMKGEFQCCVLELAFFACYNNPVREKRNLRVQMESLFESTHGKLCNCRV